MAKLSAEERYEAADTEAFETYDNAVSDYEQYLDETSNVIGRLHKILNSYGRINEKIGKNTQTCNKAWKKIDSPINVVVIGIMNHGKSTMLNALLDDTDDTIFKVADKRETKEVQYEKRDGICWTDTPGFDADETDDNKALEGITQLEVGLFVHKASTGELHANEVEVLHKLANKREEAFLKNTCIVLNDDISDDEKLEILLDRIEEQLEDALEQRLKVFRCNPKSYQKGLRENKELLKKQSGIARLHDWIMRQCDKLSAERDGRIDQTSRDLNPVIRSDCKEAIEKLEEGIQEIEEHIQLAEVNSNKLHNAIRDINRIKDRMRTLRKEIIDGAGMFGGLMSVFGGGNSDFEENHSSNMEALNNYINDLTDKKNKIVGIPQRLMEQQNDFKKLIQGLQRIHENQE